MSDTAAYRALVTSNSQSELDPIEIGLHILNDVDANEKGGRGKEGGISEYARCVGISEAKARMLRDSAKFALALKSADVCEVSDFFGKYSIAYEGSRSPSHLWPIVGKFMLSKGWSVADTKHYVSKVAEYEIPEEHQDWLKPESVIEHFLTTKEFAASTVTRLIKAAEYVLSGMTERGQPTDAFRAWLTANRGAASWDERQVVAYGREREAEYNAALRLAEVHGGLKFRIPNFKIGVGVFVIGMRIPENTTMDGDVIGDV